MGKQCLTFTAHRGGPSGRQPPDPIQSWAEQCSCSNKWKDQICYVFICTCPGRPQGLHPY